MSSPYELGKPWIFSVNIKISKVLLKIFNKSSICWQGVNDEIIPTLFIIFSLIILNLNNLTAFPEFYQNPLYLLLTCFSFQFMSKSASSDDFWEKLFNIFHRSHSVHLSGVIQPNTHCARFQFFVYQ